MLRSNSFYRLFLFADCDTNSTVDQDFRQNQHVSVLGLWHYHATGVYVVGYSRVLACVRVRTGVQHCSKHANYL